MSISLKEISIIAATWWGDVISNPKFNNGDDSPIERALDLAATLGSEEVSMDSGINLYKN